MDRKGVGRRARAAVVKRLTIKQGKKKPTDTLVVHMKNFAIVHHAPKLVMPFGGHFGGVSFCLIEARISTERDE
jgi:hypothetical protein